MSHFSRLSVLAAASAAAALVLVGCASGADSNSDSETVTDGKLTIATGEPAYAPWVMDNNPESGEGLEAAVAYAVAEELGYAEDDVVWVRSTFDGAIAPGPKDWDLNIQQFSVTEERKNAVDFSSPYYVTTQAVVAPSDSPAADAKGLADLKDDLIGVASGTTSLSVAQDLIDPSQELQVFNSVDDTVSALKSGNIDAMVTDLPGAFYVRDAQLEGDGVIVGQLDSTEGGDEFAFVLPKDSALTSKVDEALATLEDNGTLDDLAKQWLANQDAPILK
ncbi:MAG: ABC transporter substrate-binding protein [Canibacter sp.]